MSDRRLPWRALSTDQRDARFVHARGGDLRHVAFAWFRRLAQPRSTVPTGKLHLPLSAAA